MTSDGHLRIAKVTVSSPPATPARTALGACVLPVSTYVDDDAERSPAPAGPAVRLAGDLDLGVTSLNAADGAQVTVAGDVSVNQVSVDVIIGDV